jgi:hypothetical protein
MLYIRKLLKYKENDRVKVKGYINVCHANSKEKEKQNYYIKFR